MHKGIGVSKGIGIGNAIVIKEANLDFTKVKASNPEDEIIRFQEAKKIFVERTAQLADKLKQEIGETEAMILQGQIAILSDPMLNSEVETLVHENCSVEEAVTKVCNQFIAIFTAMEDELMRQRATDIEDIKTRLLKILIKVEEIELNQLPKGSILVVKELTPSMTASMTKENVAGIVTESGGMTSHSAILARALSIPAVLSIDRITSVIENGMPLIVDGEYGTVIENPTNEQLEEYKLHLTQLQKEQAILKDYIGKKTVSADGYEVELFANIGNAEDASKVAEEDGEGIGLFRTEFLFMHQKQLPTEEEQFLAYQKVLQTMKGKTVIIRTLDIGGDKDIPYLSLDKEANPFLGFCAIRFCLEQKEIFKVQLRALLRASVFGALKILLPMVTCVEEVRKTKAILEECKEELQQEGIPFHEVLIGVMIETPAACQIADLLAKEVDFFSIGTNDLIQYTLAADRGNAKVAYLYSVYQPAVLRSIHHVIACAKAEKIMVGLCGEAAADPNLIPILLAFGLEEFSVSPSLILEVRKIIHHTRVADASEQVKKILEATTLDEVMSILRKE